METPASNVDLSTHYLGLRLSNPLIASASPLSEDLDNIRRMEDAGVAAVVMHSLFEEQIMEESHRLDHYLDYGTESFAEALSYFPDQRTYHVGPDEYLSKITKAKESVDVPIIASLNGVSAGGWTRFAQAIEEAGADALELNVYYIPTSSEMAAHRVETLYRAVVKAVRQHISIPLAVKMGPYFSSPANMIRQVKEDGANAVVLFNRFYQPDLDLETLEVVPRLHLSSSSELLLPLRWTAIVYGRIDVDIAITGGVHTHEDLLKSVMAGANAVMTASELLRNGLTRITDILADVALWMSEREYESISQMRGSMSQKNVKEPTAFERANYMKVLQSWRPDPAGTQLLPSS
ncbi:MAG: dihydroorotate dehydrogenase-like protein [Bacteroidota bacterium]